MPGGQLWLQTKGLEVCVAFGAVVGVGGGACAKKVVGGGCGNEGGRF